MREFGAVCWTDRSESHARISQEMRWQACLSWFCLRGSMPVLSLEQSYHAAPIQALGKHGAYHHGLNSLLSCLSLLKC